MFTCTFLSWLLFIFLIISVLIAINILKPKPKGCVVSATPYCSRLGGEMMEKGGTAADAAIATLLCESVHFPGNSGLGGSFLMIITNTQEGVTVLNALGRSPANAEPTNNTEEPLEQREFEQIMIPGALKGYGELHKRYGKLLWEDLFAPTIKLCQEGITLTKFHRMVLIKYQKIIRASDSLRRIFVDPRTNKILKRGKTYKLEYLGETLKKIAKEGPDSLYRNGSVMVEFNKGIGGRFDPKDLNDYTVKWEDPLKSILKTGHKLYVPSVPGSGPLLIFLFNLFKKILSTNGYSHRNWSKIIESFKFMFAMRRYLEDSRIGRQGASYLVSDENIKRIILRILEERTHEHYGYYGDKDGDPPKELSSTQVTILSSRGNGISVTATINSFFGSGSVSAETGIILNNEGNDFRYKFKEGSQYNNTVGPLKRPMHFLCPVIVLNQDNTVRLLLGATNGPRILTSIALVMLKHLFFEMDVKTAVNEYRLHHQLIPMNLFLDEDYKNDQNMVNYLEFISHNITYYKPTPFDGVWAIANTTERGIRGVSDLRSDPKSVYYIN